MRLISRLQRCPVLFAVLIGLFAAGTLGAAENAPVPDGMDFFESRIRPILVDRCYKCHSAESDGLKGGLRLDSKDGMLLGGDSGKPAIKPWDLEKSRLIEAVGGKNPDLQMPPKKPLSATEVADFATWINLGAPDPRTASSGTQQRKPSGDLANHWAFRKPVLPPIPKVKDNRWIQTPIDAFVLAKLAQQSLMPSPKVDLRKFIRRATFDLTGLPPTKTEVDSFITDNSPNAEAKLIDRLLSSPRYGERWGRAWLDVARYADTKGYVYSDREEGRFVHAHVYRDWVIQAFNDDLPYDHFLQKQLAADQLATSPGDPSLAALGFLTLGRRFLGVVHDIIDDRIDVLMRGTQGLTVGCARCHDHKFDPIPTKDYYSLYGVFNGAYEKLVALEQPVSASNNPSASREFAEGLKERRLKLESTFKKKREELLKQMRGRTTDYLIASLSADNLPNEEFYSFIAPGDLNPTFIRQWAAYLFSTGKNFHPIWTTWHAAIKLGTNHFAAEAPRLMDRLLAEFGGRLNTSVTHALRSDRPASMHELATVYGRLLVGVDQKWSLRYSTNQALAAAAPELTAPEEQLRQVLYGSDSPANIPPGALVDLEWFFDESTRVELGKLQSEIDRWIIQSPSATPHSVILEDRPQQISSRVFKRGNPANKGEEVPRQFLQILAGADRKPFQQGSGRLELARAIADKANPLTARVLVNRVWQSHFGFGLVRTPSDFGIRADPPTHPELLDWLAIRFMDDNWSIKKLHRLIMLSSVYQQDSALEATSRTASPAMKGQKSSASTHSPEIIDPQNRLLWRMNDRRLDFEALRDSMLSASGKLDLRIGGRAEDLFKPPIGRRRTIYGAIDRQFLPGVYRVFDFANPDMHSPQRSDTTVPQQALFFMNSPFVVDQARSLAALPSVIQNKDPRERIRRLIEIVYQRRVAPWEIDVALGFIRGWEREPPPPPAKPFVSVWRYGYGEYDSVTKRVKSFENLPHFNEVAWQGGDQWPDAKLGWVQLTADGGHAGNDLQHAAIRRWVAPADVKVNISGTIHHKHSAGDGIRAFVVSSQSGELGRWTLLNRNQEMKLEAIEMRQSESIDFIVDLNANLNSDDFSWAPIISVMATPSGGNDLTKDWNAKREFGGPSPPPPPPLNAWERYAQVLLLGNEFVFVD